LAAEVGEGKRMETEDLIRHSDRLEEANILPSVGSVGESYDNAMSEMINGIYKTEVIRQRGTWKQIEDVEYATLE
jgi:putative transposase